MVNKEITLAEKNRARTTEKVQNALERLKRSKKVFTLVDVAEKAEISRRSLYNRTDLMGIVKEAIAIQQVKINPEKNKVKEQSQQEIRYANLRKQNKTLLDEQTKLLEQNMLLTRKVTELENKNMDLQETIFNMREGKVVFFNEEPKK